MRSRAPLWELAWGLGAAASRARTRPEEKRAAEREGSLEVVGLHFRNSKALLLNDPFFGGDLFKAVEDQRGLEGNSAK